MALNIHSSAGKCGAQAYARIHRSIHGPSVCPCPRVSAFILRAAIRNARARVDVSRKFLCLAIFRGFVFRWLFGSHGFEAMNWPVGSVAAPDWLNFKVCDRSKPSNVSWHLWWSASKHRGKKKICTKMYTLKRHDYDRDGNREPSHPKWTIMLGRALAHPNISTST